MTRPRPSPRRPTSSGRATRSSPARPPAGVALQVAPLAKDNKVLFISGPAAADAVTGANRYTFRSGRQTYQDVATAGTMLGDVKGKKVTVLAQDSAFGKANVAAVTAILGAKGATVERRRGAVGGDRPDARSRRRSRTRPPTCSSSPGPAPTPPRCGRRSASRGSSTRRRSSPASTSSATHAALRRGRRRRSTSSRTSSTARPTTPPTRPSTRG